MPNWVFNELKVSGSPTEVQKLKEQMNKPFTDLIEILGKSGRELKEVKYSNPVFSFRNIIAPTDLKVYRSYDEEDERFWYDWNTRNWGVEWDVAVPDDGPQYPYTQIVSDFSLVSAKANRILTYKFRTPLGTAEYALLTLSLQYPTLRFTLEYQADTGWGGETQYQNGKLHIISAHDTICWECCSTDCFEPCESCNTEVCQYCKSKIDGQKCENKEAVDILERVEY